MSAITKQADSGFESIELSFPREKAPIRFDVSDGAILLQESAASDVIKPAFSRLVRLVSPSQLKYGHVIPACNGFNQVLGASHDCGVQSNGTGPRAGSCRTRSAA